MEPRISLVTLGVADLARARSFYEALGWVGQEVQGTVFVQAGPLALVLWGRAELAADSGIDDVGTDGFGGVALAHNVRQRAEVDAIVEVARAAGAAVTREPAETFYGGYAACFTDLDGHVWEVAHNPGFALAEDGSLLLPDFGSTS
ncbi:MAG: VOC family protein [Acidimicrobiales bacterium]|nr:VOC family protein [Acidimicrobiales bacterium]HRW38263.1 VOC family protein [Aquihabitans sp.]